MNDTRQLRAYALARQNLADIACILAQTPALGDLHNQIKRAAVSVMLNIAEATAATTPNPAGASSPSHADPTGNCMRNWMRWSPSAT